MLISNYEKHKKNQQGFTLVELAVVLAGLATLAAFAIPNVLNSIKLNRIEEAKALMNSYAADCLGQYRISTDPIKFVNDAVPSELDNDKLLTLGYKINGNKSKCNLTSITPANKDDNFFFSQGDCTKTFIANDFILDNRFKTTFLFL